jgi:stress response protein YsnF
MSNSVNNTRIDTLVEKLRQKLNSFVVIDPQGERIGEVKDLILDANRQLNLVVSQFTTDTYSRLFLLVSKLIQKIDPPNQAVLVNINKSDIKNLPEYVTPLTPGIALSEASTNQQMSAYELATDMTSDSDRDDTFNENAQVGVTAAHLVESAGSKADVDDNITLNQTENEKVLGEEIIRLLGERLIVDRSKRKVGEVIVRKEIETRMVEVPVRYEKLIVEQVSPEHQQLAEIDLGQGEIPGLELSEAVVTQAKASRLDGKLTVSTELNSPKIASLLLNAIALERNHGCKQVRIEIVVENEERQKTYQEWFDRCSVTN